MKSFKQYILENEEPFVAGVFGDGKHNYSVNRLIQHTRGKTPTMMSVADLVKKNAETETHEGNFGENIKNPSKEFSARVARADIQYPILVHDSGWIIDGSHRLAKLHSMGASQANVYVLTDEDLKHAIITSEEEFEKAKNV